MGLKFYFDVQVSGRPAAGSAGALARKADLLACENALGYLNVQSAFLRDQPAFFVDFGHPQCEGARPADEGRLQIEQHLGVVIFAAARVKLAAAAPRPRLRAEQRIEKIA